MKKQDKEKEWVGVEFFPSQIMINLVNQVLLNTLNKMGVVEDHRINFVQCVDDISRNILEKGYEGNYRQGQIKIKMTTFGKNRLTIEITDSASSYVLPKKVLQWPGPGRKSELDRQVRIESRNTEDGNWCRVSGEVCIEITDTSLKGS